MSIALIRKIKKPVNPLKGAWVILENTELTDWCVTIYSKKDNDGYISEVYCDGYVCITNELPKKYQHVKKDMLFTLIKPIAEMMISKELIIYQVP